MLLVGGLQTVGDVLAKLPKLNPDALERGGRAPLLLLEHLEVISMCNCCSLERMVAVGGMWREGEFCIHARCVRLFDVFALCVLACQGHVSRTGDGKVRD